MVRFIPVQNSFSEDSPVSSITDTPIRKLPSYAILFCALLTFAITLGVIGGYIYFPEQASATFGEISGSHPLYFLATWAPGIAGILLVLAYGGLLRCAGPLFAPSVLALRSGLVGLHPERHPGRLHGGLAHQGRAAPCTSAAGGRGRHGRPHVHHAVSGADGGVRLAVGARNRFCSVMSPPSGPGPSSARSRASGICLRSSLRAWSLRNGTSCPSSSAISR